MILWEKLHSVSALLRVVKQDYAPGITQSKANLLIVPTCVASARLTRNATTSAVKAMAGLYCRSRGYSSTRHAEIVSKAPDTVARQERTTRLKGQDCNDSLRFS